MLRKLLPIALMGIALLFVPTAYQSCNGIGLYVL